MDKLFAIAESEGIEIWYCNLGAAGSASVCGQKGCYIAMDYSLLWNGSQERVHAAHELGHCVMGAFYNMYSPLDIRAKHERRADKWAVGTLIPEKEFRRALCNGYSQVWDLAEYFGVTEDLVRKAASIYCAA